ncbi:hypothetical protein SJAG_04555 [Schizosaccharomyces japonicus yFS275]|uniref:Uncharacterized protein n=1 Tax=Schizosaccharomyces japonicus (strain yFS275 / FY16936) TaxID=402676 RepID=B6K751_SCHJY|nr:hypothetical protein SJAG_04555 [Schizosaccharomyces japonicus yFS275]EEB09355.1 hypothetical protein SJAG_04555 [Schizosaccharomyces japonicus yFS275]
MSFQASANTPAANSVAPLGSRAMPTSFGVSRNIQHLSLASNTGTVGTVGNTNNVRSEASKPAVPSSCPMQRTKNVLQPSNTYRTASTPTSPLGLRNKQENIRVNHVLTAADIFDENTVLELFNH